MTFFWFGAIPMMRGLPQRISGLLLSIISLWICIESLRLSIGSLRNPGPGFIGFLSGIVMGVLSVILTIFPNRLMKDEVEEATTLFTGRIWKVVYTLIILCAYAFFMEILGFLISTFLLMIFLLAAVERQKWWIALIVSALSVLGCYILFILCLHISLPKGSIFVLN
jgi:putative tricarboxylic transport membrane protein